jgi:hypothetical protein
VFKQIVYTLPLVFFAFVTVVFAQASDENRYFITRQECVPLAQMMDTIVNKYGETALFTGEGISFAPDGTPFTGGAMFLVNQTTGSWSLITLYGDGMACLTAVGTEFEPYSR